MERNKAILMDMGSLEDYFWVPVPSIQRSPSLNNNWLSINLHGALPSVLLSSIPVKSDKEKYREGQENCGLNIGDTVRITRKAISKGDGWENDWVREMDDWVGKTATIVDFFDTFGIELENKEISECCYDFPYFVLELVGQSSTNSLPQDSALWNTTCSVCGQPAYQGLFYTKCSNPNCKG